MNFALSTIMFPPPELAKSLDYARELGIELEIFPMWHDPAFGEFITTHLSDLRGIASSFHEQYHFCDHSFARGTKEHKDAFNYCRKTFEAAVEVGAESIVFHHNNRLVSASEKADMIKHSTESLHEMNALSAEYGIPYVVENAGVIPVGNLLFDEDEFIALFDTIPNNCLLDIGHAHCNDWDLSRVIWALKDKIVAYHVHDNDRTNDGHKMLGYGTLDTEQFMQLYNAHTPNAQIILEYSEGAEITPSDLVKEMALLRSYS